MGGSIGEHVWCQSYKMSTSQVTFGANLIKCQLLMSTSTVILARILQSVNFSIYRYILGNTNTGVCSDIGNTNTSIHPVSYCPIWDEAVLIPDHFSVGCPVRAVTPAVHSAQKRAQAGTAPTCHAECTLCDGSRCSSARIQPKSPDVRPPAP